MYEGSLPAVSERETWFLDVELLNNDTSQPLEPENLDGVTFELCARGAGGSDYIRSTLGNGLTIADGPVLEWRSDPSSRSGRCPRTLDLWLYATRDGDTVALAHLSLPVTE